MRGRPWTVLATMVGVMIGLPFSSFAASFKVLHTFTAATDGMQPQAALIFDKAGDLYGTTVGGGLYNGGTVFELTPNGTGNWTETILYNFQGDADGERPIAGLAIDGQGNLYGTTELGGISNGYCPSGCGVVFELSPGSSAWNYQVIYTFAGVPDGAFPSGDLVFDSIGNLYGVTAGGGKYDYGIYAGCGTVFELLKSKSWEEQLLYTFNCAPNDAQNPAGKLLFDKQGALYGTSWSGGTHYAGAGFQLKPFDGTWIESLIYNFCADVNCGGNQPNGGLININGQFYGTASLGGNGNNGTVFELKEFGSVWIADSYSFDITDGAQPWAPILYRNGVLYGVTEQGGIQNGVCTLYKMGNGVVFELSMQNKIVTETVLYEFTGGSDGCGPMGGLIADAEGNLYGTASSGASGSGTVFEVTP